MMKQGMITFLLLTVVLLTGCPEPTNPSNSTEAEQFVGTRFGQGIVYQRPYTEDRSLKSFTPVANTVQYAIRTIDGEDYAIYQGDMILGKAREIQGHTEMALQNGALIPIEEQPDLQQGAMFSPPRIAASAFIEDSRWPNSTIPYDLSTLTDAALTERVRNAARQLTLDTALTIVEVTPSNAHLFGRTLRITPLESGCAAYVGYNVTLSQVNQMWLAPNCTQGNIMHEFFHSAGMPHEHSRIDRDEYVRIFLENVRPGVELSNFAIDNRHDLSSSTAYDYDSMMHYQGTAFALPSVRTIVAIDSSGNLDFTRSLGQREAPSVLDIQGINRWYGGAPENALLFEYRNEHELIKDRTRSPINFPAGTEILGYSRGNTFPFSQLRVSLVPKPGEVPIYNYVLHTNDCFDIAQGPELEGLPTLETLGWRKLGISFYASLEETAEHSVRLHGYFNTDDCDVHHQRDERTSYGNRTPLLDYWVTPAQP